jgi:UDPglucose 6-dehydrogenase
MREAASIRVVNELIKRGITDITGYDPKANKTAEEELGNKIKYASSIDDALKDSECAFLITEWDEFKALKPEDFKNHMKTPSLIDGRRIYNFEEFNKVIPFRTIGRIALK